MLNQWEYGVEITALAVKEKQSGSISLSSFTKLNSTEVEHLEA